MTKFSNKFKKPCFWPHFPKFDGKKIFPGMSSSVIHNFTWDSSTMPKFTKKFVTQFQENAWTDKRTDRRTVGRKDKYGQTLFYRTLPATAGGPINFFLTKLHVHISSLLKKGLKQKCFPETAYFQKTSARLSLPFFGK